MKEDSVGFKEFNPDVPIAIIGAGVMGAKVAWACASSGLHTKVYDISREQAELARHEALSWSNEKERLIVENHFELCDDLEQAVAGVQLAFENVPEDLELKKEVLAFIDSRLDTETYLGTNTSSLTCSPLANATKRPDRFFNLNFSDPLCHGLVELMVSPAAATETITFAKAWAKHISMVLIQTKKEQMGYAFNRLWRVIKKEALRQVSEGVIDAQDLDRAWRLVFGTKQVPFGIIDGASIPTIIKVEEQYYNATGDETDKPPPFLYKMLENNELGVRTGKGFYEYPNPAYERRDWLMGED